MAMLLNMTKDVQNYRSYNTWE